MSEGVKPERVRVSRNGVEEWMDRDEFIASAPALGPEHVERLRALLPPVPEESRARDAR